MHLKPFRRRVLIVLRDDDERYYETTAEDAEAICRAGLAEQLGGVWTWLVQHIRLTVDPAALQQWKADNRPAGRPRPGKRAPDSSSGGGDQGNGSLVGQYQALHYGHGILETVPPGPGPHPGGVRAAGYRLVV